MPAKTTAAETMWSIRIAKARLGVTDQSDESQDFIIAPLADATSQFIERQTGRTYVTRSFTEFYDTQAKQKCVFLYHSPIVAVTSVKLRWNAADTTQETITSDYYRAHLKRGMLELFGLSLPDSHQGLEVTYTAGYGAQDAATLPAEQYNLGLDLLKLLYTESQNNTIGASSVSIGNSNFLIKPDWPKQIKDMLSRRTIF